MHRSYYVEGTELHLCDLDPKVKVKGQKAGICDGVPSTSALVLIYINDIVKRICVTTRLFADDTSLYIIKDLPDEAAKDSEH